MEDEITQPENVVQFRADQTERPIALKPEANMFAKCNHRQFLLDGDKRTVECGKCGEVLDPWFVLTIFASETRLKDYRLDEWNKYKVAKEAQRERQREKDRKRDERCGVLKLETNIAK